MHRIKNIGFVDQSRANKATNILKTLGVYTNALFVTYTASLPLEATRVRSVVVHVFYGAIAAGPDCLGKDFVAVVLADRQTLQHIKETLAFRANHP